MDALRQHYTIVFSQVFSPCGKYLAAGNNYGKIGVFSLSGFLNEEENSNPKHESKFPVCTLQAHDDSVYAMTSNDKFLISGGNGVIHGWRWTDVKSKETKPAWSLSIPQGENLTMPEVNSLCLSTKGERPALYAGGGDNKVYCWDLESGTLQMTLEGHTDYIHCVTVSSTSVKCASASEDGSVRIWDTRKPGEAVHILEPHKHEDLHRPRYGKWVGCVALDNQDDWMVCGGGPRCYLWHMRSLSPVTPLVAGEETATVATFYDDTIITAGSRPFVYHWSFAGDIKAEVPTSASSIYSIAISEASPQKVLSAGGTSYKLDICTNFMYRDFSLFFPSS
ncbi:THO complex subunit 6 isoform X2 [Tachypleus tridentatus]